MVWPGLIVPVAKHDSAEAIFRRTTTRRSAVPAKHDSAENAPASVTVVRARGSQRPRPPYAAASPPPRRHRTHRHRHHRSARRRLRCCPLTGQRHYHLPQLECNLIVHNDCPSQSCCHLCHEHAGIHFSHRPRGRSHRLHQPGAASVSINCRSMCVCHPLRLQLLCARLLDARCFRTTRVRAPGVRWRPSSPSSSSSTAWSIGVRYRARTAAAANACALADLQPARRALECEFELAGLAPRPRLISAILEYAILAGSSLSP